MNQMPEFMFRWLVGLPPQHKKQLWDWLDSTPQENILEDVAKVLHDHLPPFPEEAA